ncbi:MAG: hypothetical protein P8H32_10870 [Oceanicoccus sp.]|uniref:hypothetical protein n=1 Tax=Oceanicoccus sp. TaxID=2691044 RepID=UPI0026288D2B|nr:hypothetical protein [Oceanicoccus sp.]MDG1773919.1 hypothetical protein [Oceanicoccus sp.]
MHISPSLLLLLLVIFVFSPSIQEWVTQGGTAWYRPYQLWLITIVFVWWSIRRYERRQNAINEKEKSSNEL